MGRRRRAQVRVPTEQKKRLFDILMGRVPTVELVLLRNAPVPSHIDRLRINPRFKEYIYMIFLSGDSPTVRPSSFKISLDWADTPWSRDAGARNFRVHQRLTLTPPFPSSFVANRGPFLSCLRVPSIRLSQHFFPLSTSSSKSGEEGAKAEKRRAHAQQVTALRQKMAVLLCQPLLPTPTPTPQTGSCTTTPPVQPKNSHQSAKELRKKMTILGMIFAPQQPAGAGGASAGGAPRQGSGGASEDRTAAQTRWLDDSPGERFGGSWDGRVRTGASCDSASLEIRTRVEAAKKSGSAASAAVGINGRGSVSGQAGSKGSLTAAAATEAFTKWNPNPDTPDPERWGGRWGKPCGHNEVRLGDAEKISVLLPGRSRRGE